MFEVSKKFIPRSNAWFTHAMAFESSTPTPYVSHDPSEISDTTRSLLPRRRYSMLNGSVEMRDRKRDQTCRNRASPGIRLLVVTRNLTPAGIGKWSEDDSIDRPIERVVYEVYNGSAKLS